MLGAEEGDENVDWESYDVRNAEKLTIISAILLLSQYSDQVMGWTSRVQFPAREEIFHFFIAFSKDLGPILLRT
jgi:hypothetical protein